MTIRFATYNYFTQNSQNKGTGDDDNDTLPFDELRVNLVLDKLSSG